MESSMKFKTPLEKNHRCLQMENEQYCEDPFLLHT